MGIFAVILTAILSSFQSLFFYFRHDDFAVLYSVREISCDSYWPWPYNRYCSIYSPLNNFFGLHPLIYYLIGSLLWILTCVGIYLFLRQVSKNNKLSLVISLLFASGYVGAMNFYYIYAIITTFISLSLFIFSLIGLIMPSKDKKYLILSILFFIAAIFIFPVRGASYVFSYLVILIFISKFGSKLKIVTAIFSCVIFLIAYLYIPSLESKNAFQVFARAGSPLLTFDFIKFKITTFLQTISYMVFDTNVNLALKSRILIGLGFVGIVTAFFILKRKTKSFLFLLILGIVWLSTQYIPQGLVTDWPLETIDRYIIFPYIGFIFIIAAIGTTLKAKLFNGFLLIVVIMSLMNLIHVNQLFKINRELSDERRKFYEQLTNYIVNVKPDSIFYFDAPQGEIVNKLSDFMRVGYAPTEASVATILGTKLSDIKVITESQILERLIRNRKIPDNSLFTFYYDGTNLINTTHDSRYLPKPYELKLTAGSDNINLSSTKNCNRCKSFEYLKKTNDLKGLMKVTSDENGEDTSSESLNDENLNTYWVDSLNWYEGKKPTLTLDFGSKVSLDGFSLYYPKTFRQPTDFEVLVDGKPTPFKIVDNKDGQKMKIIFESRLLSQIRLQITKTSSDMPSLNEIYPLPKGYADVNLTEADQLRNEPIKEITKEESTTYYDYLSSGVNACLEWKAKGYGSGKIPFLLKVDNRPHNYNFLIPTTGGIEPEVSVSCLNIAVKTF